MTHPPINWDRVRSGVARLNAMPASEAVELLLAMSGSRPWAEKLAAQRPFEHIAALTVAERYGWHELPHEDLLDAFAKHPRIGERNLKQARFADSADQAGNEQSGMAGAAEEQRQAFEIGNEEYERRFGHVFLICATMKTAAGMLEQLRIRLNNDATTELNNATREQTQITELRLLRWLNT